jgi:transglutaminase-like putative cysteine protease
VSPCHFMLRLRPAPDRPHRLTGDTLEVLQGDTTLPVTQDTTRAGDRLHRFDAQPGARVDVTYQANVVGRCLNDWADCREHAVSELPADVATYLLPSRYCESDQMATQAAPFWNVEPGVARVNAVVAWVREHIAYEAGSSNASTTALQTLASRRGVCRDFAHLCIALCRALNLPSRMVFGYVVFDEPPQDFHAIFEVWLGRWVRFDPTDLADPQDVIAVACGRDAADIAFATIFGAATMTGMDIAIVSKDEKTGQTLAEAVDQPVLAIA